MSNRLIVGIDFGTTFSSAAWIQASDQTGSNYNSPEIIREWPGRHAPQVPTVMDYSPDGTLRRWGWNAEIGKRHGYILSWFKNLLMIQDIREQHVALKKALATQELPESITVKSLVRTYIQCLYEHIAKQLQDSHVLRPEIVPITNCLEFVMTYPAVWRPPTLQAFKDALLGTSLADFLARERVHFLREPEAFIIGTLGAPQRGWTAPLTVNNTPYERVILLDVGDNTVDFAAYNVKEWDPLHLEEVLLDGLWLGGNSVDQNFWEYFSDVLTRNGISPSELHYSTKPILLKEFANRKLCFPDDDLYYLQLPKDDSIPENLPSAAIRNGELCLDRSQMEKLFEPVINDLIHFLEKQRRRIRDSNQWLPTLFVLAGVFGDSEYLKRRVRNWVSLNMHDTILVTPACSWTATAIGAAKYGQAHVLRTERPVKLRTSQVHLGVLTDISGGRRLHSPQIQWFLPMNKELPNGPIRVPLERFYKSWPNSWEDLIVQSEAKSPSRSLPGNDVEEFGKVASFVSTVPKTERIKSRNWLKRESFYKIEYVLEVTFVGADMTISVKYKDRSYGKARIDYNVYRQKPRTLARARSYESSISYDYWQNPRPPPRARSWMTDNSISVKSLARARSYESSIDYSDYWQNPRPPPRARSWMTDN